jgi:hypothetical protein
MQVRETETMGFRRNLPFRSGLFPALATNVVVVPYPQPW